MVAEGQGRDGGGGDLFEDLDQFFASMEGSEWPEPDPSSHPAGPGSERAPRGGGPVSAGEAPRPEQSPPTPPRSETSGPPPDSGPPSPAAGPPDAPPPEPSGPATAGVPARGGETADEATGEMSGEDWVRLRDVLGDEEEEDEDFGFPSPSSALSTEESLFGFGGEEGDEDQAGAGFWDREPGTAERWSTGGPRDPERPEPATAGPEAATAGPEPAIAGPEAPAGGPQAAGAEPQDPGELTLDDLRKAPPQYRDLPGPPDQEPSPSSSPSGPEAHGAEEAVVQDEDWQPLSREPAVPPAPAPPEPPAERVRPARPPRPSGEPAAERAAPSGEGDPSLADVEAAADELAGQFQEPPGGVDEDLLGELSEPQRPRTVKVGEPESLMGPTWEEPTSHPATAERTPGPSFTGGRDLPAAVITAAVLVVVALVSLAISSALFAVIAGAVVLLGQAELYATMQRKGLQPATALGLVLGGLTLAAAYTKGEPAMTFSLALGLLLSILWYMVAPPKARTGVVANVGATMLGLVYVPFLAGFLFIILSQRTSGRTLMLAVLGLTFLYDIAAFLFGSFWGSRPLAPTISPKKSWEGLLGGTFVTFAFAIAFVPSIGPMTLGRSVALALVVSIFAPLGDLAESALKRDLGVKDMGTIMPGHGGALDRIDSALFVAPAAFYLLRLLFR